MSDLINPADLTFEPWPPRGVGGQQVGLPCGVKVTHELTGLSAISCTERSQHRNKAIALDMLLGGLTSPHFRGQP